MALFTLHAFPASAADVTLDFDFFKARVEPVFLKKRPEHVRCYVCHSESNNAFKLQHLSPGAKTWNDEQSRKNFASASGLVVPGDLAKSRLLLQPLDPHAGGNPYHSGGRQFANKSDPDWKILAEWVSGKKVAAK
jgi:hypothetical protein